jgi:hypothetical protein
MTCTRRRSGRSCYSSLFCAVALATLLCAAAKPRVRVGDDLEDVVDDEESEEWREWGKRNMPKKIERAHAAVCLPAAALRLLTRSARPLPTRLAAPSEETLKGGFKQARLLPARVACLLGRADVLLRVRSCS